MTMKKELLPLILFLPACAVLDGIKDGKFCAIAGDADPTIPANSERPNCGRTGNKRFASASYLTSFLAGETRDVPIAIVERGGSTSDDPVALDVTSGPWVVRETGEGTREDATIGSDSAVITRRTLRITAPAVSGSEDATLRYKGVQGETLMELGLLSLAAGELGANAGDDLAASTQAIAVEDCVPRAGAFWPRVIELDADTLRAKKTIYTPGVSIPGCEAIQYHGGGDNNDGCDGDMGPTPTPMGSGQDCPCSGGACFNFSGSGCVGSASCLSAIALVPETRTALIGTSGGAAVAIDLDTGASLGSAHSALGGVKRIVPAVDRVTLLLTKSDVSSAIADGPLNGNATASVQELEPATDIAPLGGERYAIYRPSALSSIDLSRPQGERNEEAITGGFESGGPRVLARPDGSAVITGRLDELEVATGQMRRGFGSPVSNDNLKPFVAALVFDPARAGDQLLVLRAIDQNFGSSSSHVYGAVERSRATATATVAALPQPDGPNNVGVAIDGAQAFVTRSSDLLKIDLGSGAITAVSFPNGMIGSHSVRRLTLVGAALGFAIDQTSGSSTPIKRIDLTNANITDYATGASCVADLIFVQGRLLVLDVGQDALVFYDPLGGGVSQIVAHLGLKDLLGDNNTPNCNSGDSLSYGLAVDSMDVAWVSSSNYGLWRIPLNGSQTAERVYTNPLGGRMEAVGTTLAIADVFGGVVVFDPGTGSRTRVGVPIVLQDFARAPNGNAVYAVGYRDNTSGRALYRIPLE